MIKNSKSTKRTHFEKKMHFFPSISKPPDGLIPPPQATIVPSILHRILICVFYFFPFQNETEGHLGGAVG